MAGAHDELFLQTILNNQRDLFARLASAETEITKLRGTQGKLEKDVDSSTVAILGNGKPGLNEVSRAHAALIAELRMDMYGDKDNGLLAKFKEFSQKLSVHWAWLVAIGVLVAPVVSLVVLKIVITFFPGLK